MFRPSHQLLDYMLSNPYTTSSTYHRVDCAERHSFGVTPQWGKTLLVFSNSRTGFLMLNPIPQV